jgi:SdrD B-like domain/Carboxypeptidase regulatory-like domain
MHKRCGNRIVLLAVVALVAHPMAAAAQESSSAGWRALTIPKTAEEIQASRQLEGAGMLQPFAADFRPILPEPRDRFVFGTGVGVVTGRDGALELSGGGRLAGVDTNLGALVTIGSRGPEWYSGRVSLSDPSGRVVASGGDLVNDMHGLSRGGSLSWAAAGRRRSTLEVYRPRFRDGDRTIAAYREQWRPARFLMFEGAAASDAAALAKARLLTPRVELEQYFHRDPLQRTAGAIGSVDIWRGLLIGGTASTTRGTTLREDLRQAFVRLPLGRGRSLRVEQTSVLANGNRSRSSAAEIVAPFGPLQVITRWQNRDMVLAGPFATTRIVQRGLLTTASYAPVPRIHLNLQTNTEWLRDGSTQVFQEMVTRAQVTRGTSVESTVAFTDRPVLDRLRLRLSQAIRSDLSIVAEVGRFPAFQAPVVAGEVFPSHLKFFVRKSWDVNTPARGGLVTGRVIDSSGAPVTRIVVRLGRFRTETGTMGEFVFERVPPGTYKLAVDTESLPADLEPAEKERELRVHAGSRLARELVVAPLGTIHGRVFVDRNGNGVADAGEGVKGAVVRLGDSRLTLSRDDGRYAFHNLEPGHYQVELVFAKERTPQLEPEGGPTRGMDLDAQSRTTTADFKVTERDKPIVIQRLQRP